MRTLFTFIFILFHSSFVLLADDPPQEISGIDASIEQFNSPTDLDSVGVYTFAVRVKNSGPEIMQTLTVHWAIDGVEQVPYYLLDFYLEVGDSYDLNFGTYEFNEGGEYVMEVWLTHPNGLDDMNNVNNFFATMISVPCQQLLVDYETICSEDGSAYELVFHPHSGSKDFLVIDLINGITEVHSGTSFSLGLLGNGSGFDYTVTAIGQEECAARVSGSAIFCAFSCQIEPPVEVFNANNFITAKPKKGKGESGFGSFESLGGKTETGDPLESDGLQIVAYPNPSIDHLNIQLNNNSLAQVSVIHSSGQLISSFEISGKEKQIDTLDWSPGVYFIRVTQGEKTSIQKVVKAH